MNLKKIITGGIASGTLLLSSFTMVLADSPAQVSVEGGGLCEETVVSASLPEDFTYSNLYLVVDTDTEEEQYAQIPTDGTPAAITVGPFDNATTVYWHVFGGPERSWDNPLWNGYGEPDFSSDINAYYNQVGTFNWVIQGTDDPNPFVTWEEVQVKGCKPVPVAKVSGKAHLLEPVGERKKDWLHVGFWTETTLYSDDSVVGNVLFDILNAGDNSLDGSRFRGSDVVEMNLFDGDSPSCNLAMNMTVNGVFNNVPGYSIILRAGEGPTDTARLTVYDGPDATGSVVYDTHSAGEFADESNCVGTARTGVDIGDIVIVE